VNVVTQVPKLDPVVAALIEYPVAHLRHLVAEAPSSVASQLAVIALAVAEVIDETWKQEVPKSDAATYPLRTYPALHFQH